MSNWIDVRAALPWLKMPPYFVAASDLRRLRSSLPEIGFAIFEMSATNCHDERTLLMAIGDALDFPDYYSANWDAFYDCLGDLIDVQCGPAALVISDCDRLLRINPHAFVRSVHLLLNAVTATSSVDSSGVQFEVFLVGNFHEAVN